MRTALLDTTILADALLRRDSRHAAARAVVSRFGRRLLPVYALKEFKRGPLHHYAWLHDVLLGEGSLACAHDRLAKMAQTPQRNLTSTAIEALAEAGREAELVAQSDERLVERMRLALWVRVVSAWRSRRSLATEVIVPLACYREVETVDGGGSTLALGRLHCEPGEPCAIAAAMLERREDLERLREALRREAPGRERDRRLDVIALLLERGDAALTESQCLALGDAVFAMFCPDDGVVVTTNPRDHAPLAAALRKSVERP